MSEVITDVAVLDRDEALPHGSDVVARIEMLKTGKGVMTSAKTETFADKVAVLNAVTNAEKLDTFLSSGKVKNIINLKDVVIQAIDINDVDQATGEIRGTVQVPRIILVDANGTAYAAISDGIFKALETIFGLFGMPNTWPAPLPVTAHKEGSGTRQYFTLRAAV